MAGRKTARFTAEQQQAPLEFVTVGDFNRLRAAVWRTGRALSEAEAHLSRLNGTVDALKDVTPRLVEIVGLLTPDRLTLIVGDADSAARNVIFWSELRRRVKPTRPLAIVLWIVAGGFLTAAGSALYKLVFP